MSFKSNNNILDLFGRCWCCAPDFVRRFTNNLSPLLVLRAGLCATIHQQPADLSAIRQHPGRLSLCVSGFSILFHIIRHLPHIPRCVAKVQI
jgi:hypothetical protein